MSMSQDNTPTRYYTRKIVEVDDWSSGLNGYSLRLWDYSRECSRLTIRAEDWVAGRPHIMLVFHDVSYLEFPVMTGKVRAREATKEEVERVAKAMGSNYTPSNVVAICASEKRVFLVEYGYVQMLYDGMSVQG